LLVALPAYRRQPDSGLGQTLRTVAARLSYRLGASIYQPYGQTPLDAVGPTTPLDSTEIDAFLQQAWGARLACIRSDGTPHVVPLWYEWNGRYFWITASANASWGQYVQDNTGVSLTIDEPWPPLRRVLVTGRAEPVADSAIHGGITGLRQRLVSRYLGRNSTAPAMDQMQWQAFRITPKKIIGQRGLGS
jgi:nitroimidazol reductase NimA-like FMN-containing flavoprotein (pyridoxamine 5'-phosphate oxidase superfamily)